MGDETDEEYKNNLRQIIDIGVKSQTVAAVFSYAATKGKNAFLKNIDSLVDQFVKGLSEDERKELQEAVSSMLRKRAEDLVVELGSEFSEEEVRRVLSEIKALA